jgi:phosphatidate cytidylyltransferase
MKRILTGLILTPFFFWIVAYAPALVFLAAVVAVALLCHYEFLGIVGASYPQFRSPVRTTLSYLAGVFILLPLMPMSQIGIFVVGFALLAFTLALTNDRMEAVLPLTSAAVFGLLYVFGSWRCAIELRQISPWWLLFAAAINWVGDTAAYFVGKNFGHHKLAPRISPGKTWAGTLGSLVITGVAGVVYLHYLFPRVPLWQAALLSLGANTAGQIGDLCESAIKRGAGVKDSGTLLPGHGGWLDRVDSSLFSIPVVYWLVQTGWFPR